MSVSTSEQTEIPTACVGVLRLTKERQSIRRERDTAIRSEGCGRIRSPWEMHSSGQIRLRARRPSARIIVLESVSLVTAYEMAPFDLTSALLGRNKIYFWFSSVCFWDVILWSLYIGSCAEYNAMNFLAID